MERSQEAAWSELELGYRSNAEAHSFLEQEVARGGTWRRVGTSVQGRPIVSCEWRLGEGTATAPCLFLLSLIHPMEWIGREVHLALLRDLLAGRIAVPGGTRIVSLVDANPDGTAKVEAALRAGRPAWVRGNARGVDLNRNFPTDFRTRPRWIDFWPLWRPGPGPLSEPESRAVLEALRPHPAEPQTSSGPGPDTGPPNDFATPAPVLAISFHSFGRWIFFPPSSTRRVTRQAREHERVLEQALATGPPRGYRTRQLGRYAGWFRAFGIEIDALAAGVDSPAAGARVPEAGFDVPATRFHAEGDDAGGSLDTSRRLAYLVELSWGGFGRWGVRRLPIPFFTFNPPRPEREIERLRPFLPRLIEEGLRSLSRETDPDDEGHCDSTSGNRGGRHR